MVSHPTTSAAPKSAAPGTRKRLSDPISSRTMCGAINPTKPSSPATLTAAAASSAAATSSSIRTRSTRIPSPAATSSPSIRMFRREEASQETRNPLSM